VAALFVVVMAVVSFKGIRRELLPRVREFDAAALVEATRNRPRRPFLRFGTIRGLNAGLVSGCRSWAWPHYRIPGSVGNANGVGLGWHVFVPKKRERALTFVYSPACRAGSAHVSQRGAILAAPGRTAIDES